MMVKPEFSIWLDAADQVAHMYSGSDPVEDAV